MKLFLNYVPIQEKFLHFAKLCKFTSGFANASDKANNGGQSIYSCPLSESEGHRVVPKAQDLGLVGKN